MYLPLLFLLVPLLSSSLPPPLSPPSYVDGPARSLAGSERPAYREPFRAETSGWELVKVYAVS